MALQKQQKKSSLHQLTILQRTICTSRMLQCYTPRTPNTPKTRLQTLTNQSAGRCRKYGKIGDIIDSSCTWSM